MLCAWDLDMTDEECASDLAMTDELCACDLDRTDELKYDEQAWQANCHPIHPLSLHNHLDLCCTCGLYTVYLPNSPFNCRPYIIMLKQI